MKSIFRNSLIAAALVFGAASISQAQVKVGANPTTIGTNSNLEVEAANGNKTIVNKATGQVTIQDGTQGVNKVLTSDANGASSWKFATGTLSPEVLVSVETSTYQTIATSNGTQPLAFTTEIFDDGNNFSLPSTFTAPTDGRYLVSLTVESPNNQASASRGIAVSVAGGTQTFTRVLESGVVLSGWGGVYSGTAILALKAGDVVTPLATSLGSLHGVTKANLEIMKVAN